MSTLWLSVPRHAEPVSSTVGRASKAIATKPIDYASALLPSPKFNAEQIAFFSHMWTMSINPCAEWPQLEQGSGPYRQAWFNQLDAKSYAQFRMACDPEFHWGGDQFNCLVPIINQESGWNHNADNKYSTAFGIGQLLYSNRVRFIPGDPNTRNPRLQDVGMLRYIKSHHTTPCNALAVKRRTGIY